MFVDLIQNWIIQFSFVLKKYSYAFNCEKISLIALSLYMLTGCSDNCAECEKKLMSCVEYKITLPDLRDLTDLPKKPDSSDYLEVRVTEAESYIIDGVEYPLDNLSEVRSKKVQDLSTANIKIHVTPKALFRPVFKLLAIIRKQDLNPIFYYPEGDKPKP